MHKRALLACLLVMTMLFSGCSLIVKDMDVDAATPILTVGDKVFTKAEVQSAVNTYLQEMQAYYAQNYNYTIDITSKSTIEGAQSDVLDSLTRQTVLENKAAELGLNTLSEEDQAEVDKTWQSYYDMIKNYLYSDSELSEEELDQAITADVTNYFGVTKESLTASKVNELVRADTVKDVTVTDEQIQEEFNNRVEEAKTSYESNLSSYGSSFNSGSTLYYRPAGYRLVKQILTQFNADDKALMDDLNSKISELNTTISTLESSLSSVENLDDLLSQVTVTLTEVVPEPEAVEEVATEDVATPADVATETAESVATPADIAAESAETAEAVEEAAVTTAPDYTSEIVDTLPEDLDETNKTNIRLLKEAQEKLNVYMTMQNDAKAKAYANIDSRADDILAQLDAGGDWDTLMAQYTEDPGMQEGRDTAVTGYAVCENMSGFDSAFVDAAMALEKIGDHSGKVASDMYGYYIIQYTDDVKEGPVDLEGEVYDTIKSDLQTEFEEAAYEAAIEKWTSETKVVRDMNALNN